jgi:phosphoglycerate kinase
LQKLVLMQNMDTYSFQNKRALIRVDYNVPLNEHFEVTDNTRIKASIATVNKVLSQGGSVVLMSHLGRPKNGPVDEFSLKHILPELKNLLGREVTFAGDCIGEEAFKITSTLKPGQVVLLENLRFYKEEEKGDEKFATSLAKHGDVYINDAFGTAHRAHASTTIVAKFFPNDKLFGYLMASEVNSIEKVLNHSEKPVVAVIGGAKVSSKIEIIKQLLNKVTHILIGGGMAFTFIRALGGKTGSSLVEEDMVSLAKQILDEAKQKNVHIFLPTDAVIADKFDNNAHQGMCDMNEIPEGWMGLDIGPETEKKYKEVLLNSKTILWNGPMGVFEMENFAHGTISIANSIVEGTKNGSYSLVGGGDSVAALNQFGLAEQVSYVSTGGGAMLEYLEGKVLPGVAAIIN